MIAAVILAAGMATRMGENKLLIEIDGRPLVARVADAALGAGLAPVVVVTGHEAHRVQAALEGRPLTFAHNPDFAAGLAGSLKAGMAVLPVEALGVLVCLGDMPDVSAAHLSRIVAAFPANGRAICVPTRHGRRGNPVLLGRPLFPEMQALTGDIGARGLIAKHSDLVREVPMDDDAVLTDLDTAESWLAYRRRNR
ncbi:nucleotidyltransferase family protein [Shumkonia mesophila]|uniref:nucleotidyltransferase family protein n=1 Tax=Shumkonia mesophila TaxID=2838854 RepID=UPI0029351DFD|nr:nucleotidyltransferase family protein [Shumkonia mesophila]